jgi:hypothetical protein
MTYDDWKSTDPTPEPDPNSCEKCEHQEGNCDCRCCNEPEACDHCDGPLSIGVWILVATNQVFCSPKCLENEKEARGMARAAADLR